MKYLDGQEVFVGDELLVEGEYKATVVNVIDTRQGTLEHPVGAWDYLEKGMMVVDESAGLVHYPEPWEGVELVKRKIK